MATNGFFGFKSERGSFAVAGAFFMIVFLMIAGLGVDVANYFNRKGKVQNIADGAALAGASAMSQHADTPARHKAYNAALSYIKSTQGDSYVDLYNPTVTDIDDNDKIILHGPLTDVDGDTFYKFGVMGFGDFDPYFLPRQIFGGRDDFIQSRAVARVEGKYQVQKDSEPIDCGVYLEDAAELSGNNFDASGANFCGNSDILADSSTDGTLGDVHYHEENTFTAPGGGVGRETQLSEEKTMPRFKDNSPADYYTRITDDNYDSWGSGDCSTGKAVPELTWTDSIGDDVCVERTVSAGDTEYTITSSGGGVAGKIVRDETPFTPALDQAPASIYAGNDIVFDEQGNNVTKSGIDGGLYIDGSFSNNGNNNLIFDGDPNTNGGLALWTAGDMNISFDKNNVHIKGILGTDNGDINFSASGGGDGPFIEGVISSGGGFELASNANNALINHDTSLYDEDYLTTGGWWVHVESRVKQPYFANVSVRLIN